MAFELFWVGAGIYFLTIIVIALAVILALGLLFGGGKKGFDPKKLAKTTRRMFPAKGIYRNQKGQAFVPMALVVLALFLIVAFTVGGIITAIYAAIYFFGGSVSMIVIRTLLERGQTALKQSQGKSIGRFAKP